MKLATATVLCALAAASPALAAEKKTASTGLRRLGGSDVCSFLDFEGLWEGVDPATGAIHNTELDCSDDSGFMGRKCEVTIVVSYHVECGGTKTILTGLINGGKYGQFDQASCGTENVCTLAVTCPDNAAANPGQNLPLTLTQSATTKAITSCVGDDCGAFDVTLNKIGGGWKA
uniref:Uncharacterized protein n=1 Tax=Minutocellus polymorphus TaxID=265543 RepID=A0A7S0FQ05_9STRA